jgi:acetate---CoA ligase (ADP-forming)
LDRANGPAGALDDLAGIDLAVVCLAPEFVLEALERIADMGVKAVIITSAGFREIGGRATTLKNPSSIWRRAGI